MSVLDEDSWASTMGGRLRAVREREKMSQVQFAETLAVSRSALLNWEKDESSPSAEALKLLRTQFNVAPEWLLFGNDLHPRKYYANNDWTAYDRIESELKAACDEARLGLSTAQRRDLTRIIYEEGTEVENLHKGKMLRTLRVIAQER